MLEDLYRGAEIFDFVYTDEGTRVWTGRSMKDDEAHILSPVAINDTVLNDPNFRLTNLLFFTLYDDANLGVARPIARTIGIDPKLLTDSVVDDIVNYYNSGLLYGIRLIPEDAELTEEIYNKFRDKALDDRFIIAANKSNVDCRFDFKEQSDICKFERVEVYNRENSTFTVHDNIHVNRELNAVELRRLVELANSGCDNIFLNFYDPSYYETALELLSKNGLNSNVNITILANPLYDVSKMYSDLANKCSNNIKIHYNTCDDLNRCYQNYRSSEVQNYYSDIEASGICDLSEYLEMLNLVQNVEEHVRVKQYSNMEKLAYLYDVFKKSYIYDPDYETNSHSSNAKLHLVSQKDRMICEGFSNLYSCFARRLGLPCFTVGVDNHQYNVVRVTDPKYGVDNVSLLDVTWDIGDKKEINDNFGNFLRPAYAKLYDLNPSTLNTVSSLFVSQHDYDQYCIDYSNPGYVRQHFGYTRRMLELMGFGLLKENATDDDIRSAFINSGKQKVIPSDTVADAINYVRKNENDPYSDSYVSLEDREPFLSTACIRENYSYTHNLLITHDVDAHIPDKSIKFVEIEPQHKSLFAPRPQGSQETDEQYKEYLNEHYHNFYLREGTDNVEENVETNDFGSQEEDVQNDENTNIEENEAAEEISFTEEELVDGVYIPGTSILKPRDRDPYESDEEYVNFLNEYYSRVFPQSVENISENNNNNDTDDRDKALENYSNSGYGKNVDGYYYNIWIDEYDPSYKPWEDAAFNPNISTENTSERSR